MLKRLIILITVILFGALLCSPAFASSGEMPAIDEPGEWDGLDELDSEWLDEDVDDPFIDYDDEQMLLYNGDFSNVYEGEPFAWYFEVWNDSAGSYYSVEQDELYGNVLHIVNPSANDARMEQIISVTPNTYYRFTCLVKAAAIAPQGQGANLSIVDTLVSSQPVSSTEWQLVELTGKTGPEQDELVLALRLGGYGEIASGEAWFANVTAEEFTDGPPDGNYVDFSTLRPGDYGSDTQEAQNDSLELPGMSNILLSALLTLLAFALFYRFVINRIPQGRIGRNLPPYVKVVLLLGGALLLRIICSRIFVGHMTDIQCFLGWSEHAATVGVSRFYETSSFADYPPGYMYVLGLIGSICKLFGIGSGSAAQIFLVKLPAIAADLISAYIVYSLAKRTFSERVALGLMILVAFNPAYVFISSGWGQIDSLLTLLIFIVIWLYRGDKKFFAAAVYGLAVLIKPQALMFGPLLAFVYIADLARAKQLLKKWYMPLGALIIGLGVVFLGTLPFKGSQPLFYFVDKYIGTATSYGYASVEAFNLFALFGGNWKDVNAPFIGASYMMWGSTFIVLGVVCACLLYYFAKDKSRNALALSAAFLIAAMFTLGQFMHERYIFPVLLLLLIAFIDYKDRRLLNCFGLFSLSILLNSGAAFQIVKFYQTSVRYGVEYTALTTVGSLLGVFAFIYFAYVCYSILIKGEQKPLKQYESEQKPLVIPPLTDTKLHFTKQDKLYCFGLSAIYAIIALLNLGTTTAPETYWRNSGAARLDIRFEQTSQIDEIWVYSGVSKGTVDFEIAGELAAGFEQDHVSVFKWTRLSLDAPRLVENIELSVTGDIWLHELAFFADGTRQPIAGINVLSNAVTAAVPSPGAPEQLFDEPNKIPEKPGYLYETYFDEIYHARTAYEHLNGLKVYEISHPPLGKIFIMLGITLFGMNPLGWRIVGTCFGIAMVPLMYCFAKRLFKKSEYALLASVLFAFDFMHFTQTRISTIDVYGVFFIMAMFYYMYQYLQMNFFVDKFSKTLKPLALCGLMFGLGAASKWICIYAGAGLAVLLGYSLVKRFLQYRAARASGDAALIEATRDYPANLLMTLGFCMVFFVIIPIVIYVASYLPYMLAKEHPYTLGMVWQNQEYMFGYHSQLTESHPYQSPWWQWPLNIRPVWYFNGTHLPSGIVSTIMAFGNPIVWLGCLAGSIALVALVLMRKIKLETGMIITFGGVLANFLPWTLITRATFAYHYFATVPFIVLATCYTMRYIELKTKREWPKYAFMALAIVLFIMFYPVISGMPTQQWYVRLLQWLPSWPIY